MTDWQTVFAVALALSVATGNPSVRLAAVMAANFLLTRELAASALSVGVLDLACAAFIFSDGRKGAAIAALFVAMQPIYIVGYVQSWPGHATYALIDVLAFAQLAIMGGWGNGIFRHWRNNGRHSPVHGPIVAHRGAGAAVARNSEAGGRG